MPDKKTLLPALLGAALLPMALLPMAAQAATDLYIGASLGSAHLDENIDGVGFDSDANSYRLFGGIQFGDALGIEAGYLDFGEFSETIDIGGIPSSTEISGDGWTLGGTLAAPLGDRFAIFGRAGVFFWDADVVVDGFSIDTPGDENPYYGGGLRLDFSEQFSLTGDWTRYELDEVDTDVISLGFQYRF